MRKAISCTTLALALAAAACNGGVKASLPETATKAGTTAVAQPTDPSSTDVASLTASTKITGSLLTGATEPHRRSALAARVGGVISKVYVRDGDVVKAGQPLVAIDPEDFNLRLAQAEAGLSAAQAQYTATKLNWERIKKLRDDKAVPQSQLDGVDAQFEGSKAAVKNAESTVAMTRKAIRDALLTAPFSGVVTKRMVNEGEFATAMPPTILAIVEEVDPLDLRVQVPASDMGKISVGDLAKIRFPATGMEIDAHVTRVVASMDARSRTFAVIFEIPNPERTLWSGMFADVRLSESAPRAALKPAIATQVKE